MKRCAGTYHSRADGKQYAGQGGNGDVLEHVRQERRRDEHQAGHGQGNPSRLSASKDRQRGPRDDAGCRHATQHAAGHVRRTLADELLVGIESAPRFGQLVDSPAGQ